MNFVELRILHLIELLRNFAVRSLKRNSKMQFIRNLKTQTVFCIIIVRGVPPKKDFQKDHI